MAPELEPEYLIGHPGIEEWKPAMHLQLGVPVTDGECHETKASAHLHPPSLALNQGKRVPGAVVSVQTGDGAVGPFLSVQYVRTPLPPLITY